jgi:serine acetyltransferase
MLTGFIMFTLYSLDIVFGFLLISSNTFQDGFAIVLIMLGFHFSICILLVRFLQTFFPVPPGKYNNKSKYWDYWRAYGIIYLVSSEWLAPFLPMWLKVHWFRLFGAKIEMGVTIHGYLLDPPLIHIKRGAKIGFDSMILGHAMIDNELTIGRVVIGENATVGARSSILPNSELGRSSTLGTNGLLTSGKKIHDFETWIGVPARPMVKKQIQGESTGVG